MLKNYLRIAYRNLFKGKAFSFVNIFGLAVGMASFLFIIHYVRFERSYENFHKNADNIYRITLDLYNGNEYVVTDCETYAPVGPMLKEKMTEVQDYVRMLHNDGLQEIEVGARKFLEEGIYFADASAFNVFSLKVVHGDKKKALTAPFKTVLTESIATKYFGRTDVIGESVKIHNQLYQITAIISDLPPNTHLKFHTLVSHATLPAIYQWYNEDGWNGNNEYTYLLMAPGVNLDTFNKKLVNFAISLKDKIGNERFVAEPIKDIHLLSTKSFEPEPTGSARAVYFLLIIAVFIIFIAWVNYINLSTARAIERAREVGIRKVMGSLRGQLIFQFLAESVVINLIAALLAFIFFQTGLPIFRDLSGLPLQLDFIDDPTFWFLIGGLIFAGSILSGIYPAIVLSSFQPSAVLKGKFRSSSHGQTLRKGLVIFQFSATVILMVCMCAVYLQINFLRSFDLGMNLDQTLVIRAPRVDTDSVELSKQQSLKTALLQNVAVQNVALSETLPGLSLHELNTTSNVKKVGEEKAEGSYNYYFVSIDADYIPTLDMKLVSGRNFDNGSPNTDQVIINEEAVTRLGFSSAEEAIGSKITFYTRRKGEPATIIGVIQNYHHRSPKEQHIPMFFNYHENAHYFSVKLKTKNIAETVTSVKKVWDEVFPNTLFHYFFLNETYDQQYQSDARFGKVIAAFSALAVFIACLGLFGLSAFTIVQRTKEIGIRKILGASVLQIVHLLSRDFAKVIIMASLLALPIAYFAVEQWLDSYAIRINLTPWLFAIPVIVILIIAMGTVSFQTLKTALENPTHSLKQE